MLYGDGGGLLWACGDCVKVIFYWAVERRGAGGSECTVGK